MKNNVQWFLVKDHYIMLKKLQQTVNKVLHTQQKDFDEWVPKPSFFRDL